MYKTVFNTTDSPLVVDDDGRVIGGHEWGTVDSTDDVAKGLIENDSLIVVESAGDHPTHNPEARSAFIRTEQIAKRAEQAAAADKSTLQQVAVEAGLVEEGEKVGVRDLREAVAESTHVQVPSKTSRKSSQKREA